MNSVQDTRLITDVEANWCGGVVGNLHLCDGREILAGRVWPAVFFASMGHWTGITAVSCPVAVRGVSIWPSS